MKSLILGVLLALSTFAANALTPEQQEVKDIAAQVGSSVCVDKQCFGKTLQAIAWQESSYGKNIDPKAQSPVYYLKEKDKIIYIKKDDVVQEGSQYYWRKPMRQGTFTRAHPNEHLVNIDRSSLGTFQIKPSTAKYVIEQMKLSKFYALLTDEKTLISKLLNDHRFGATIAVNYLKMNYVQAKSRGAHDPWFFAVSKYNGGANNTAYVNRISSKIAKL